MMSTYLRGRGQLARGDDVLELVALEELHRHVRHLVGLADVVDGDDVGMVQAPRGLDLLLEALPRTPPASWRERLRLIVLIATVRSMIGSTAL
jgi:hypothetical protein